MRRLAYNIYYQLLQPSIPETVEETCQGIIHQLEAAMMGVKKNVKDLQTASGIKDPITQHWINCLLPRGCELH